jgi:hypothetical protein
MERIDLEKGQVLFRHGRSGRDGADGRVSGQEMAAADASFFDISYRLM